MENDLLFYTLSFVLIRLSLLMLFGYAVYRALRPSRSNTPVPAYARSRPTRDQADVATRR